MNMLMSGIMHSGMLAARLHSLNDHNRNPQFLRAHHSSDLRAEHERDHWCEGVCANCCALAQCVLPSFEGVSQLHVYFQTSLVTNFGLRRCHWACLTRRRREGLHTFCRRRMQKIPVVDHCVVAYASITRE